jgi:hypothetical protein
MRLNMNMRNQDLNTWDQLRKATKLKALVQSFKREKQQSKKISAVRASFKGLKTRLIRIKV